MRRPRVFATSSFRLSLVYAALTGVSFCLLFAVIFWSTARFMRHQIDDSVGNELNEVLADSHDQAPADIARTVEAMARHPSGFFYLYQGRDGRVQAGNLPGIDPLPGIREWPGGNVGGGTAYAGIRGQGMLVPGGYLFVGWSTRQLNDMERFVAESFIGGLLAAVLLALAGGGVMSSRLLRKIENVSATSRNIVNGDLKQRFQIRQGGDEFDHLALSINSMLDRIETLMTDLREVTTDIAHDLRTPLTRLRNRLELAQRTDPGVNSLRDTLSAARDDVDGILEIFAALLRIAQIESGARRAAFASVDMNEVIDIILEIYRPAADEKHQQLAASVEPGLAVVGDKELLIQLFANLVENATLHSPPGASVLVSARAGSGGVLVAICDDGPGIPEAMRAKVLTRFFRLEGSRTTQGSGLGLSLASAIANLHAAPLILADNEPGLRVSLVFSADPFYGRATT